LKSFSGSIDVFWDETDTTGQGALTVGSEVTIKFYPEGATTGDTFYSGSAIVTGKTINGSFDGMVEASITVQGTGALATSTAT
jgi:predicted secreted protein